MTITKKGNIFVISAASGTGKTSLIRELIQDMNNVRLSISHTTRSPREHEVDGEHYHFVSKEDFLEMVGDGEFVEFAEVHDNYYGTHNSQIKHVIDNGMDIILEIDVQGAFQVKKLYPECVMIFILPPSFETLEHRLVRRDSDSQEVINKRLKNARKEMEEAFSYDYLVINDDFNEAIDSLRHIIEAQRSSISSNKFFLENLLGNPV